MITRPRWLAQFRFGSSYIRASSRGDVTRGGSSFADSRGEWSYRNRQFTFAAVNPWLLSFRQVDLPGTVRVFVSYGEPGSDSDWQTWSDGRVTRIQILDNGIRVGYTESRQGAVYRYSKAVFPYLLQRNSKAVTPSGSVDVG